MKFARYLFLTVFLILSSLLYSQSADPNTLQSVFPSTVYIGDSVEIRYVFHSEVNLLGSDLKKNRIDLSADYPVFLSQEEKFTVLDAYIENNGNEYIFLMNIVPWKKGLLEFPYFDLCSLISYSTGNKDLNAYFYMNISPFQVFSIAEKNDVHSFLPPSPPILIPGTVFLIVVFSILALVLLGSIIFGIANIPQIRIRLVEFFYFQSMKKVSRKTIKKLLKLKKFSSEIKKDSDFALNLQKIFREYMSVHFSENFRPLTTSEISMKLNEIYNGETLEVFDEIVSFFSRTDYIRFGNGNFLSGEREKSVEMLIKIVEGDI